MPCTLSTISNHTSGFNFGDLFTVYLYLNSTCPPESDIFFRGSRMLTNEACKVITRAGNSIWTEWKPYPIADIWDRLATWKLPLVQLVGQFPRPPLGWQVETATMAHLIGDPIDSMASLLLTLAMCKLRAVQAKQLCSELQGNAEKYDRVWKALAIIMVSFDECGRADRVTNFCTEYHQLRGQASIEEDLRTLYETTAYSLAADRATRTLPVVLAEAIFIGGWLIALGKAASSDPSPTNWANVEVQSVAISAMYLWVTSAVAIGSFVGTSQTEGSIPRILHDFEFHMGKIQGNSRRQSSSVMIDQTDADEMGHSTALELEQPQAVELQPVRVNTGEHAAEDEQPHVRRVDTTTIDVGQPPVVEEEEADLSDWRFEIDRAIDGDVLSWRPTNADDGQPLIRRVDTAKLEVGQSPAAGKEELSKWRFEIDRAVHGGVLSWRPTKWEHMPKEFKIGTRALAAYNLGAVGFVGMGYVTAAILSSLPPPQGVSCRHIPESLMFAMWLSSFAVEYFLEKRSPRWLFWAVFWKDIFFGLSNIAIVMVVQWGIMNSCSCWSMWGWTGLHLPQMSEVQPELMHMVRHIAPWWVSSAVVAQLVLCFTVLWWYRDAVRVYIQRDDELSNWPDWIVSVGAFFRRWRE